MASFVRKRERHPQPIECKAFDERQHEHPDNAAQLDAIPPSVFVFLCYNGDYCNYNTALE